jgi:hypothetical protein
MNLVIILGGISNRITLNIKILLAVFIFFTLFCCEKDDSEGLLTKQLRIDFCAGGVTHSCGSVEGRTMESTLLYTDFNKNNYKYCKSIIFKASMLTMTGGCTCYLELYNCTDSTVIPNSALSTSSRENVWVESRNLINDFPDKNIDLTLKLRTDVENRYVAFNAAHIYINF